MLPDKNIWLFPITFTSKFGLNNSAVTFGGNRVILKIRFILICTWFPSDKNLLIVLGHRISDSAQRSEYLSVWHPSAREGFLGDAATAVGQRPTCHSPGPDGMAMVRDETSMFSEYGISSTSLFVKFPSDKLITLFWCYIIIQMIKPI